MQLHVKTPSQTSTITTQSTSDARPPYSKAYHQQSRLLHRLELEHAKHRHFQRALDRKQRQLSAIDADLSRLSLELLTRQIQSLEVHMKKCEAEITALRAQLDLNMAVAKDLAADEEQMSSAQQSASPEVFAIGSPVSSAFASAAASHAAPDKELAERLGGTSLDAPVDEVRGDAVPFVPADGWESVLGTWI